MNLQTSISSSLEFCGIGLHTGELYRVALRPAGCNHGIAFTIAEAHLQPVSFRCSHEAVADSCYATTLTCQERTVRTVEHLLAAIYGLGITNINIEIEGGEIPILDGSALPISAMLVENGIIRLGSMQPRLEVIHPLTVSIADATALIEPAAGLEISYSIEFPSSHFPTQSLHYVHSAERFLQQIAPARTFGFLKDLEMLRKSGLIKGGSLNNAVVIDEAGKILNDSLRYSDEAVRHKILDFLGDLALSGFPIQGHFRISRGGHAFHVAIVRSLLAHAHCWRLI